MLLTHYQSNEHHMIKFEKKNVPQLLTTYMNTLHDLEPCYNSAWYDVQLKLQKETLNYLQMH